ncbi:hypothetical protein QR680_015826 [Steinernema hermaphroditum]|uniref:Peptidase M16 N-terminal domain-containing protein n=1 Tax=Steinernema hermaphroditum TaxID=289476 RepID=A0AA39HA14_9BILA|nr:hypothetical protein QR680_015826 [Steinernema hermaphroditum]
MFGDARILGITDYSAYREQARKDILADMLANRTQNGERRFRKKAKKNKRLSEKDIRAIMLSAQTAAVRKRYGHIKRPDDRRKYRGLEFSNGLRVLLVSDRSKTTCAAAVDVHVGSCADPEDVPGMAHLCEHLLLEGSEKYPMDSGLGNLAKRSGGEMNACTGDNWTNFELEVPPKFLKGLKIRDEVVKFFEEHYSSHVMSLCVSGPQSLDVLEDLVLRLPLLEIPNRNVTPKIFEQHYYGPEETGYRVDVVPIKNERSLTVKFVVQHCASTLENSPIGRLLEYEGEGSLARELKQRSYTWCDIDVRIELTQEGFDHVEDIVHLLFAYIGMLKRTGPREVPPKRQSSGTEEISTVLSLVMEIRNRSLDYRTAKRNSLKATSIKSVLDQLTPRNMIYIVVAKENSDLANLEREQYYGIEYRKTKLNAASVKRFGRALKIESELFYLLEKDGQSFPRKSALKTTEKRGFDSVKPYIIWNDQFKRIWYLKSVSDFADRPATEINAYLTLPRVASDAKSQIMAQLFTGCLEYQTREESYDAEMVGYEASVEPRCRGLKLTFFDFDDRICQTVGDYMRRLISFEPEKKVFDVVLAALKDKLSNFYMEQPYDQGDYLLDYVLTEGNWPNWQLLEASKLVTFEELVEFVPTLWNALHLELFAHGTLAEDNVLRLCDQILPEKHSRERPLSPEDLAPLRKLKIPAGISYFYEHKQTIHSNSCVVFCLQAEPGVRNYVLLELLALMIKDPAYYMLRTKEKLGYTVWTNLRGVEVIDGSGLCITVQGPYDPNYVESRIEAFLENFKSTLKEMSESDFEEYKDVFHRNAEKLNNESYWQEIEAKRFSFDDCQLHAIIQCIELQREDVLDFYERTIVAGADRRKLSIWVRSVTSFYTRDLV